MRAMTVRLVALVPAQTPEAAATLDSLDRQTMPPGDYRILLVDDGRDAQRRRRLDQLTRNRVNVEVADSGAPLDPHLTDADGLLVLEPGDRLTPDALEVLADFADRTGADVCLARTSRPGSRIVTPEPAGDQDRLDVEEVRRAPECARLHRVGFLQQAGVAVTADSLRDLDERALDAGASVAWCAERAAVVRPQRSEPSDGQRAERWTARARDVGWREGILQAVAELQPADGTTADGVVVRGCVFRRGDGIEWPLAPCERTPDGGWQLSVDPATAAAGGPLVPGQHRVALLVTDPSGTERVELRVEGRVRSAVHRDGVSHVVHGDGRRLGLDVGARSHPVVQRIRVDTARVAEDARGSLLTAAVPDVSIVDGGALVGELKVGGLPVKAWVEADGSGGSVLRSWVSGLTGSYDLSSRFSAAPFAPTGGRLVVDALGEMTVTRTPPGRKARPEAPASAAPGPEPRWKQRVRAVPGAVAAYRLVRSLPRRPRRSR
jgi:hypothetical protein